MIEQTTVEQCSNKWKVTFFFHNEKDAKHFYEHAETAYNYWRFSTGKLPKPKNDKEKIE